MYLRIYLSLYYCCSLVAKSCLTLLWSHGLYLTRLLCPWDFPGKNTGVGCHFLLWGSDCTCVSGSPAAGRFFTRSHLGNPIYMCVCIHMYLIWYKMEYYPTIKDLEQQSPTFLAPGPISWGTIFPRTGGGRMLWGWFKCITFIMHFVSTIISSAPLQIIRH